MKIAFVSFEYPPDTAVGGIATYVGQIAKTMHNRGHYVEVFCASFTREGIYSEDGIIINRIKTDNTVYFKNLILPVFIERNKIANFDILESPEYNADGLEIKNAFPFLPLTVKLHTPRYLINELNNNKANLKFLMKSRIIIAHLRRFKKPVLHWKYYKKSDPEYLITKQAELITSPSISLGDIVAKKWKIPRRKIINLPYPFTPNERLLNIPIKLENKAITYFGRLEIRKGVMVFADIIPVILKKYPDYKFYFIGRDLPSPVPRLSMKKYLSTKLHAYKKSIHFIDHISQEEIIEYLRKTDICIFPSLWENFPNVCLEAMSGGRAIIASNNGGMMDMLQKPEAGILVNPTSSNEIIEAVILLISNQIKREMLGNMARKIILTRYTSSKIGEEVEKQYETIIHRN